MFPKVSIILTTYNGASRGFLKEAIDSVLSQTFSIFELLIIDDGSKDSTRKLCEEYCKKEPRIKYHYQQNLGPGAARNFGIKVSNCPYISFLDDDDSFHPTMIEELYKALTDQSNEQLGMVYCGIQHVDASGKILATPSGRITNNVYKKLFSENVITTSALLVKKSVFEKSGLFNEYLRYSEDYDLWLRIAKHYQINGLDRVLVNYRVHEVQLSKNPRSMEHHHGLVLFRALEGATDEIRANSSQYYYLYYFSFMRKYLGMGMMKDFQRMYHAAKKEGSIPFKWKCKYYLSFSKKIFYLANFLYKKRET